MSDPIQETNYNGGNFESEVYNYKITEDSNGQVRFDITSNTEDIVELIWNDDKSLTIVVNGKTAVRLNSDQAKNVLIDTHGKDDVIFVTGDTPVGDDPDDYKLRLYGGDGNDKIIGSDGNEQLEGGKGVDRLWGMGGNDKLYGHHVDNHDDGTTDYMYGGDGHDDLFSGNDRQDIVHGNAGNDDFHGGTTFGNNREDDGYTGGLDNEEFDSENGTDPAPVITSNADNIHYLGTGPSSSEAPTATDDAELLPDDAEAEGSDAESAIDEPSASEPDATSGDPRPRPTQHAAWRRHCGRSGRDLP